MLICGVFAMLERARQVLLPLGSTLTAVAPGAGGNILVGSEEGIIYIVTPSGALQCVFATKSGTVTRICNHEALLSVVTVESTPEEPGVPPSHFLQMYSYAVGESDDGSDEPAVVNPKPLSLSAGALSLAVCPLTGKIVILLQNGVLIVLECIDDGFELVLEMAYSGVLLTAAAVYDRFLCVASSSEVRIVKLHGAPIEGGGSSCDADCPDASCDLLFDVHGSCLNQFSGSISASFPSVSVVEPTTGCAPRRTEPGCLFPETPLRDPAVTVTYNTAAGYGCKSAQFAAPTLALVSLEPTDEVVQFHFRPCDGGRIQIVVTTKFQALSFLLWFEPVLGELHPRTRVQLVAAHKWLSQSTCSTVLGPNVLASLSPSGFLEVWSCWFDPHTPSTLNRFHADLQKWFVDQAPTLLCVVDLRRESGNVEWPPGVPMAVGVEGGVALFHTPHAHANSSERPGCVWTWQWCGFTDLLAQVTAEAVRSFLEEDADDSVSDVAASEVSGSPMSTVSSKRLHLNIPSATFVGGQTIARLLCLWSISAQECERAWAGIKELAGSSGGSGHTSRNSFSAYAQALSLARGRLQCWSSLAALSRIAGRWNKLSPESIVTSKLCDWSELCYLMWMGVDPTDLLPEAMWAEYAEEVGPEILRFIIQVLVPAAVCAPSDPKQMTTAFSLLTKLGGLLQDSVDVSPPWLSVPQASLHFKPHAALLHLIQCLPSDPLRFIIQSVVDIISAQCCTTLNVPEGKVKVLASSLACHSTGSACSTCQSGALLLAACYERLGELVTASKFLLLRPLCFRPVSVIEMLKSSADCTTNLDSWSAVVSTLSLLLAEGTDELDDVRQAYTAALAFLATRTETRFLFARLPPAASVREFQETIRQALSQSLGRTAVETTIKDIESLLYED